MRRSQVGTWRGGGRNGRAWLRLGLIVLVATGCGRSGGRGGAAGAAAVSDLFDGRTLEGWQRREGGEAWAVESGEIVVRPAAGGGPALLVSERERGDFALMLEFKVEADASAGVIVRGGDAAPGSKTAGAGYTVDLSGSAGGLREQGNAQWLDDLRSNPPARRAFKSGEWNALRVVAVGDTIRTEVNGVAAANYLEAHPGKGWIGLWADGSGAVRWRSLKLKSLE